MPDKYSAVWVSHTSINDFLKCPRSYYLKNVYRDPKTNHKIKITGPALALGMSVHEVLESLSVLPKHSRFSESLVVKFDRVWQKVSGKKGGFLDDDTEWRYKQRGQEMLRQVMANPGPLAGLAVKIKEDLPHYWLSEEEGIILCGKIDWLEYLPEQDSVHIIDFKTGKNEEETDSLQLPIYHLLVHNCQKRKVIKASYWYLDGESQMVEKRLPELLEAHDKILDIARQIKVSRQINRFKCPEGDGCRYCRPMERILKNEAELVGEDQYHNNIYILPPKKIDDKKV